MANPIPNSHPDVKYGKTGLLLVNLGTPDGTGFWEIRRYLREFLSDQRVIEVPPVIWQCILHGIILNTRPPKTGAAYRKIWKQDTNESPLRYYTRMQAEKLAAQMAEEQPNVIIDWAMRYGNPSIDSKMQQMREQGCDRIAVIPLYPQYAAATTATVADEVFRSALKMRRQPTIRVAEPYEDHPAYIDALADSITKHLETLDWKPDVIIASYHGIPKQYFDKGDPYHCYCHKTTRLLREKLGMDADQLRLTFQSRFGPKEWLQPYTDKTLEALPEQGVKKVVILTPGFAADCVETLEEIEIEGKESFMEAGGTHYSMVPCLNDSEKSIEMLKALSHDVLAGFRGEVKSAA